MQWPKNGTILPTVNVLSYKKWNLAAIFDMNFGWTLNDVLWHSDVLKPKILSKFAKIP